MWNSFHMAYHTSLARLEYVVVTVLLGVWNKFHTTYGDLRLQSSLKNSISLISRLAFLLRRKRTIGHIK